MATSQNQIDASNSEFWDELCGSWRLNPAEFGQIAGRAGRHLRDGTFGTSGRCPPFDAELVEAI